MGWMDPNKHFMKERGKITANYWKHTITTYDKRKVR